MQKLTINPSIAAEIDISPISYEEKVKLFFNADENWTGTFDFKIWNSYQKNTEIEVSNSLTVVEKVMSLTIEPIAQNLPSNQYWYEISSVSTKRLLFKGKLNIVK
jgi:hypothetical protein